MDGRTDGRTDLTSDAETFDLTLTCKISLTDGRMDRLSEGNEQTLEFRLTFKPLKLVLGALVEVFRPFLELSGADGWRSTAATSVASVFGVKFALDLVKLVFNLIGFQCSICRRLKQKMFFVSYQSGFHILQSESEFCPHLTQFF